MAKVTSSKLNIAIIHPDLGIGGAERLIVDAAVELASQGHKVHVFTAHHDKNRCFEETVAGTFPVTVYGSFLPRHIFYHLHALCAYLRCLFVAFCVLFMWHSFDVILADQVSVVIPILKIKRSTKVVFYCHFPDLLLAQHSTFIRRMYRKPIDYAEEITTGIADLILVNSKFTASTFANTFKYLDAKGIRPAVLYPAVNVDQFNEPSSFKLNFLSINRFERKKNIQLAISAFAMLNSPEGVLKHKDITNASLTIVGASYWSLGLCCSAESAQSCSLCVNYLVWICGAIISQTGGFDKRLKENVEYLEELKDLAEKEGVSNNIKFITSCSTAERNELLSECLCVLYTPKDEHFGIVPLEAMAAYKPVIACNSGGPVESIKNGVTGFLCDPTPLEFSLAMAKLISDPQEADNMGREARRHVVESFSTKSFGQHLNRYLVDIHRGKED
ncbi:Alpha-1,3/1,6-mannosyltransferase ALG2 isoform B [Glycine soja]|uniref:Alpha-1,3/1,6-mannosyltransferase ALG2 n=2 Tax=Glycine soja TaxID=3848 RepID=A0A445IB05_GLYSO|nr:Alpha-1,3/1,6-mannosyltransferase ALG2 isoform B [Glycine soja]